MPHISIQKQGTSAAAAGNHFPYGGRKVILHIGALRQITDFGMGEAIAIAHPAAHRCEQTQQALDQRALAGAVFTDHAQVFPALNAQIQILNNVSPFIGETGLFAGDQRHQFSASFNAWVFCHIRLR